MKSHHEHIFFSTLLVVILLCGGIYLTTLPNAPMQPARSDQNLTADISSVVASSNLPTLPLSFIDTTMPDTSAYTVVHVSASSSLQAAINAATCTPHGTVLMLQAGATFTGNFTLPANTNCAPGQWIIIRTDAQDSELPPPGTRISPSYSAVMPKIVSPNTAPAISALAGTNHYRFVGVEITTSYISLIDENYGLVVMPLATTTAELANNITFDRDYIHGVPNGNVKLGLAFDGANLAVVDSYISDIHGVGQDTQAINDYNGPGPLKIVNNYLSAAGENILFGGAVGPLPGVVPSDIDIEHNYFFKPLSWQVGNAAYAGIQWSVKNILEFKDAQRVLVNGNIFQNNWVDGQVGYAILFTPRAEYGDMPQAVAEDITFTNNILEDTSAGFNSLGLDNNGGPVSSTPRVHRILIQNNILNNIGEFSHGDVYQILSGTQTFTIDHNTVGPSTVNAALEFDGPSSTDITFTNNITPYGSYGVDGTGVGLGQPALNMYAPGAVVNKDVFYGSSLVHFGSSTNIFFPTSTLGVGFMSANGLDIDNLQLLPTSLYKNAATDGTDIGANVAAVNAATAGAITGTPNGSSPTPTPPPPPPPPTISVALSTLSLAFGNVSVGSSSATLDLQVKNNGTAGVMLAGLNVAAPFSVAQNFCVATATWNGSIAPNTHCDMYVVFTPQVGGSVQGLMSFSVGGVPESVSLSGSGSVPSVVAVSLSAASLSFSATTVGSTSPEIDLQLKNNGAGSVMLSNLSISPFFSISRNFCVATATWNGAIAPNTHCDIYVVFTPQANGIAQGTLSFSVSGVSESVVLTGSGTGTIGATSGSSAPVITVQTSAITTSTAIVTIQSNVLVSAQMKYGPTTAYGETIPLSSPYLTTIHENLTGLAPNTVYDFIIIAFTPSSTQSTISQNYIFKTQALPPTPAVAAVSSPALTTANTGGGSVSVPFGSGSAPSTPTIATPVTAAAPVQVEFPRNLVVGDSGNDVLLLQKTLQSLNYFPPTFVPTNYFGPLTEHALLLFQCDHQINSSGFLDLQSQTLLNKVVSANPALASTTAVAPAAAVSVPAQTTPAQPPTATGSLTRYLSLGSTGPDVSVLQQALFNDGDYSEDIISGYFGLLTQKAVEKFQTKYGIVSSGNAALTGYGAVGPRTRAELNSL